MPPTTSPLPPFLQSLTTILSPTELIHPTSSHYPSESRTWSASKNLSPKLIARPASLASLSRLLAHLDTQPSDVKVNIATRSQGVGSASASDLLISVTAFDGFEFHPASSALPARITVGTGQSWVSGTYTLNCLKSTHSPGAVDHALDSACPGAACLSARCSFVGVGGSLTSGGLSWLSSEHGMASDPANLLDATIVLADGRIVRSAKDEEPDLLWAIRGGGGGFGVVVSVTLRVFPDYAPKGIFTGRVFYPRSQLDVVVKAVAAYSERCEDPKMAMHFYCLTMEAKQAESVLGLAKHQTSMGLAIMMFDAHGEEHGRSEEGFKWAMGIEGATVMTETADFKTVNALADDLKNVMGEANSYFSGITVPRIEETLLRNAWDWMDRLLAKDPAITEVPLGTLVLIEVMQKAAFQSLNDSADAAWPHTRNRHVVQLGVAAPRNRPELEGVVSRALKDAPLEIVGKAHDGADFIPNFLNDFNNVEKIFGGNHRRLVQLKARFDPKGLFGGPFIKPAK